MDLENVFTPEFLNELFPPEKADDFFEALYGGAEAGAFDISMEFREFNRAENELVLDFILTERPGMCMACSLTHGLPRVFQRHPVIDLKGLTEKIAREIAPHWKIESCALGSTTPRTSKVNAIPLRFYLKKA